MKTETIHASNEKLAEAYSVYRYRSLKTNKLTTNIKSSFSLEKRLEDILFSIANTKLTEKFA